nr:Fic family protein [Brachybacterium sp. Marseille-Q7125]
MQVLAARKARLDESTLLALHFMVQGYDLSRSPGRYRDGEVFVHDDDARRTVHVGPPAEQVPDLMEEFTARFTAPRADGTPPLADAAMTS